MPGRVSVIQNDEMQMIFATAEKEEAAQCYENTLHRFHPASAKTSITRRSWS
jgi:hypothetical protein